MPVRAGQQRVLKLGVSEDRAKTVLCTVYPVEVAIELDARAFRGPDVPGLQRVPNDLVKRLDGLLDGHSVAKTHGRQGRPSSVEPCLTADIWAGAGLGCMTPFSAVADPRRSRLSGHLSLGAKDHVGHIEQGVRPGGQARVQPGPELPQCPVPLAPRDRICDLGWAPGPANSSAAR
jgi:hypothetical protein